MVTSPVFTTLQSISQEKDKMEKPKLLWALLCENFEVDPPTRKLTIRGQFDALVARSFPTKAPATWLLTKWQVSPRSQVTLRFVLKASRSTNGYGQITATGSYHGTADLFEPLFLHAQPLEGLTFSEPGEYVFEIYANDDLVHTLTFPVIPED